MFTLFLCLNSNYIYWNSPTHAKPLKNHKNEMPVHNGSRAKFSLSFSHSSEFRSVSIDQFGGAAAAMRFNFSVSSTYMTLTITLEKSVRPNAYYIIHIDMLQWKLPITTVPSRQCVGMKREKNRMRYFTRTLFLLLLKKQQIYCWS